MPLDGTVVFNDFCAVSGPTSLIQNYTNVWSKSYGSSKSLTVYTYNSQITAIKVLYTGYYEVFAAQRGVVAYSGTSWAYIGLADDGSRSALEDSTQGIWTHDHAGGEDNFSTSYYIGKLNAGVLLTAGAPNAAMGTSTYLRYSSAGFSGYMSAKRIG